MLMQHTLTQPKALKLDGMARAFEEQSTVTASTSLSFEERVAMLVDRELAWRDTRRLERLLHAASSRTHRLASRTLNTGKAVGWTSASSPRLPAATGCAMRKT